MIMQLWLSQTDTAIRAFRVNLPAYCSIQVIIIIILISLEPVRWVSWPV